MHPIIAGSGLAAGAVLAAAFVVTGTRSDSTAPPASVPAPAEVEAPVAGGATQTAVFAGGCFWGMQLVFEHVKGVEQVTAGYAGGAANTATYTQVETGVTGHAESVQVRYDPSRVTYDQLLQVFFTVAHDPTELNRQGPDVGTQYRSAIFYGTPAQEQAARAYIAQLEHAKTFPGPIVTQVVPLRGFYPAESYHQDFADRHPDYPYIVYNDRPKLAAFQRLLSALYQSAPAASGPGVSTAER